MKIISKQSFTWVEAEGFTWVEAEGGEAGVQRQRHSSCSAGHFISSCFTSLAYETGRGIVRVSPPPSARVHPSTVNHQKGRVGVCVEEDAYIFIGRVGELCGAAKAM